MPENDNELQPKYPNLEKHKWKKGQTGNPLGRKPRATFIAELSGLLAEPVDPNDLKSKTKMRALCERLFVMAMRGDSTGVKAMAVLLPHIDPVRLRNAIRTSGNVNILNVTGDLETDRESLRAELDQFIIDLPNHLRANGLPASAIGPAMNAIGAKYGGISPAAGNALMDALLRQEVLPLSRPIESTDSEDTDE